MRRIVQASTRPGDWCLDFFAGSGTLGAVAAQLGRRFVLVDSNPDAIRGRAQGLARLGLGDERVEEARAYGSGDGGFSRLLQV